MLIEEIDNGIYTLTICEDGYVFDNKKHKLFVLKKSTMDRLHNLINEYKTSDLDDFFDSNQLVKCNDGTKFTSGNQEFYHKVIELVYKGDNIKHPPQLLDPVISLIEELRATGELDAMIQADGMDATIDELIAMCE